MKKLLYIIVPLVIIVLSVLVMISGPYLKNPFSAEDDVVSFMTKTKDSIEKLNWPEASSNVEKAMTSYKRVIRRIQFSMERDEMNKLEDNLIRTKAYIMAKDQPGALAEIMDAQNHWDRLGE